MNNSSNFEQQVFERWPVAAIYGWSQGDEWKWKATGLFESPDYVAVAQWWANAWHTVYFNWKKVVLHELPGWCIIESAKVYIWQWRVLNISWLAKEIKEVEATWCKIKWRIIIAGNTQLIFKSLQIKLDWIIEKAKKKAVWTTSKWIGPAYALKALRTWVTVNMALKNPQEVKDFIDVNCGLFNWLNAEEIWNEYLEEIRFLKLLIDDWYITIDPTNLEINKWVVQLKKVLIEASQSAMLAIDSWTYPFCTSSDTSINWVLSSLKIPKVHTWIWVTKAIKSKVGWGFFPTKFSEEVAKPYRELAWEFGATTWRPRDVWFFDLVETRLVLSSNQTDVLLITKADMLNKIPEVKVALSYTWPSGKVYESEIPADSEEYEWLKVNYSKSFKLSWDITWIKDTRDLPQCYRDYFDFILEQLNFKWTLILGTWPNGDEYLIYN